MNPDEQTAYEAMRQERDEWQKRAVISERFRMEDANDHMQGQLIAAEGRKRVEARAEAAEATVARLTDALRVIQTTTRGDEKSECRTIRKWLDKHGVFNDDIQGAKRLVEAACLFALSASSTPDGSHFVSGDK